MNKRQFRRGLRAIARAYIRDDNDYTRLMDDMVLECSDEQWDRVTEMLDSDDAEIRKISDSSEIWIHSAT